jgi:hypothetical protein
VFLAHHSGDKQLVVQVGKALRRRAIYPLIDIEQIRPGIFFQDAIQAALRRVRAVAVLLGSAGIGRWQRMELRTVLNSCVETGLTVVPVLLPGLSAVPDELPFLAQLQSVRFERTVAESDPLDWLVWAVTGERPMGEPLGSR